MKPARTFALALAALTGLAAPAAAQTQSAYTDLDLDECLVLGADDFGARYACPGYKGYPVWVREGSRGFSVSFGFGAPGEPAAEQAPYDATPLGPRLEWRLSNEGGAWKPFATILRWRANEPGENGKISETLVVTKLEPGNTCHVAYVSATLLAVPDADPNEIARDWADSVAPDFDCAGDDIHLYPS